MKFERIFAALIMGVAAIACSNNAATAVDENGEPHKQTAKEVAPTKAEADSAAYLWGVNIGMMMKQYGFDELSFAKMKKGMEDAIKAKGSPRDTTFMAQFKISPEEMGRILDSYINKKQQEKAIINEEKEAEFFAKLDKKGVTKTESGLYYELTATGSDVKPSLQDTVFVEYKLTLPDGTVVDQSEEGNPARMMLTSVIEGFREGLQLIGEGGEATLYVPAKLGYGERGSQMIEPNTPLTFAVKLTKVAKAAVEEAPAKDSQEIEIK